MPQGWIWIAGTLAPTFGVALPRSGHPGGNSFAGIGSNVILIDSILFARLVFQAQPGEARAP